MVSLASAVFQSATTARGSSVTRCGARKRTPPHHLVGFGKGLIDGAGIVIALKARLSPSEAWITAVAGSSAVRIVRYSVEFL